MTLVKQAVVTSAFAGGKIQMSPSFFSQEYNTNNSSIFIIFCGINGYVGCAQEWIQRQGLSALPAAFNAAKYY